MFAAWYAVEVLWAMPESSEMSENSKHNELDPAAAEAAGADGPRELGDDDLQQAEVAPGAEVDAGDGDAPELSAEQQQIAELQDQALRAKAEVDNMRRRTAREVEGAHKFAIEKFARELLPVLDSLEKAVDTAGVAENSAEVIAEGVALCLKLFSGALEKSGVERIDPLGEPFDPQHHEAMTMVDNPDAEPNSVMDVMQAGYVLNGRVLRAAKVVVVKPPATGVDTVA